MHCTEHANQRDPKSEFFGSLINVAAGAGVDFFDNFDNQEDGGKACKVLYVHSLVLGSGSTIVLHGCNIYYEVLIDEGATCDTSKGGELIQVLASDTDGDGRIDWRDFSASQNCFANAPVNPSCTPFDFDNDDDVDRDDFGAFVSAYTGADHVPPPGCCTGGLR